MKKIILLGLLVLLTLSLTSAICTISMEDSYNNLETALVTMSCSEVAEKLDSYALTWINETGYILETDIGTTPSKINTNFYESYIIPSDYSTLYGSILNVTLTGEDTEGSYNATISSAGTNDLILTNPQFSYDFFIGKKIGMHFDIEDENGKKITGATCNNGIEDTDGIPIEISMTSYLSMDGHGAYSQMVTALNFREGTDYLARISCYCGTNNSGKECIDEDGNVVLNSIGSLSGAPSTKTWLRVNTVTDKSEYEGREVMHVCANLTNIEYDSRIPVAIFHQVRCSAGIDNNNDLDRVLILSDDDKPDYRGINVGTTQMQCKNFIIEEKQFMQGLSNECYASTEVWVLDANRNKVIGYSTTSPKFNITLGDIQIDADWQFNLNGNYATTIINLSESKFGNINAIGVNNLDIRLQKDYKESIRAEDQYFRYPRTLNAFFELENIINITAKNLTGHTLSSIIELNDDGNTELEIQNLNFSEDIYLEVTMHIATFEERSTEALEGIENKTGTFAFSVEANQESNKDRTIDFLVSAQLEISDQDQVEGFFSCYLNGHKGTTEIQFEHAINKLTAYTTTKTLNIPEGLEGIQTTICDLGFIGFGNDKDTASDTFIVSSGTQTGSTGLTEVETVIQKIKEKLKEISKKFIDVLPPSENKSRDKVLVVSLIVVIIGCLIFILTRRKND